MRLLLLSDLHGDSARTRSILSKAGELDLILVAGDLTEFGGARELDEILSVFGGLLPKLVAIPGNCDRRAARERLAELGISADGRLVERGGLLVAGVGGGSLRSGLTPYERREDELSAALETALAEAGRRAPLLVLSHQPPKGTGADERHGTAVGSSSLRALLDASAPLLWACGHIHESHCARRLGPSLVVNPGPANRGRYAILRIEEGKPGCFEASAELFS